MAARRVSPETLEAMVVQVDCPAWCVREFRERASFARAAPSFFSMKGTTTRSRPVCGGVLRVSPFLRTSLRIIHVWLRIHAVDGETRRPDGTPGIDGNRRRISESGQRAGQIAPSRMHRDERLTYLTCDRYKKLRIPVVSYSYGGRTRLGAHFRFVHSGRRRSTSDNNGCMSWRTSHRRRTCRTPVALPRPVP